MATTRSHPGVPTRPDWLPEDVWPYDLRTVLVDDVPVSYTDVGSGPTMLFCHAGMWSFVWRDVIDALRDRYRCVAFDPPGVGLSPEGSPANRTLTGVRDTVVGLVEHLDLQEMTLVMHDLGGPAALAAADRLPGRVAALTALNTFGWRPSGPVFRTMLAIFGSAWMRELHATTGWLSAASSTRFGVGRHLDSAGRRAFRAGMDREGRRSMHLLFRSARDSDEVYEAADRAIRDLGGVPALTVFGSLGDHLRFRPKWRARLAHVEEVTIPRGLHFPMCDDPRVTAASLDAWHRRCVAGRPGADGQNTTTRRPTPGT